MKVDVNSLGTFNRLAHEGAEHAAAALSQLTAIEPAVEATKINIISKEDLDEAFRGREFVGVRIGIDGGLSGQTVLVFDPPSVRTLLETLRGNDGSNDLDKSRVKEVGNILVGGFLDGWADYLETTIDPAPPEYLEGSHTDLIPDDAPVWDENQHIFGFTSQLDAAMEAVTGDIYLFPEPDSFAEVITASADGEAMPIPLDKLTTFSQMTKQGAGRASDNITSLTGIETTVEVSKLSFVPVESIPSTISDEPHVGAVLQLSGLPSGYIAILFDEPSARAITSELVPADGDEFSDMHRSAIQEICNITTSGFIDGWANVLGTTIDISPPQLVHDLGRAILDPVATRLGQTQEFAFVIDSTLETTDRTASCDIYALPDERELRRALDILSVDFEEEQAEPGHVPGMEASYENL